MLARAVRFGAFAGAAAVLRRRGVATVALNYQEPDPDGRVTGRYINQPDQGDVVDTFEAKDVQMHDGRTLETPATLESMGFCCASHPTKVADFRDDAEVTSAYYDEVLSPRGYAADKSRRRRGWDVDIPWR